MCAISLIQSAQGIAVKVAAKADSNGSVGLLQECYTLSLNLCLHVVSLLVAASATQKRKHVMIVLLKTFGFGTEDCLRSTIGKERAKSSNAVQDATLGEPLKPVLCDETKCLGVYHNKIRNV